MPFGFDTGDYANRRSEFQDRIGFLPATLPVFQTKRIDQSIGFAASQTCKLELTSKETDILRYRFARLRTSMYDVDNLKNILHL